MKKIVFLVGESGCGKSHLQEQLIKSLPYKYTRIISTTTREPRVDEVYGKHYFFIGPSEFCALKKENKFLQSIAFGLAQYGTQIKEYEQEQPIGIFVCTPEGINDTIEALEERGIDMEYNIVFFMTTNNLLRKHKVDQKRIDRGNIRLDFIDRYNKCQFNNIGLTILVDQHIDNNLYTKMEKIL